MSKSRKNISRRYKSEEIKKNYQRERRRVLNYISSMKRRGYDVSEISVPAIPKNVTEGSIRRLRKLDSNKLRSNMNFLNPYSGEVVSAGDRKEVKRLRNEIRAYEYIGEGPIIENIYNYQSRIKDNFIAEIKETNNKYASRIIIDEFLNSWIFNMGEEFVGEVLHEASMNGISLTVEEHDSYPSAKRKSLIFIRKVLRLSNEYSEEEIDNMIDRLDEAY